MLLTDTHTHLYAEQFDEDRDEMFQRAMRKGVNRFFLPNIDLDSVSPMLALVEKYSGKCFPMIGIHPCSVGQQIDSQLNAVEQLLEKHRFVAIGEIGIDLYWDKSTLELQQKAFRTQVKWAKEKKLPIAIHCRDAFTEITDLLDELNDDSLRGVFHCFTGTMKQAEHLLSYGGFKLGIGGIVTFKNGGLAELLGNIGIEHLVLETDAPYLAPAPYRGKRNESAYLYDIAEKVAKCYDLTTAEIATITTNNSIELFGV
jgi:TatD DNase family protein